MMPTYHQKIRIFKGPAPEPEALSNWLDQLQLLMARRDVMGIRSHLAVLVPEYNVKKTNEAAKPRIIETVLAEPQAVAGAWRPRVNTASSR
jgi:hypothetical protein